MTLTIDASCDVGLVRMNNEDMVLIGELFLRNDILHQKTLHVTPGSSLLVAVSDGMGGHQAGEIASEYVLHHMNLSLQDIPDNLSPQEIKEQINIIVKQIHHQLNNYGVRHPASKGLGCTFTGVFFHGAHLYAIHVGDSRLYRFRGAHLSQMTVDHTLRNMLNDPSIPSNKLTNSFGGGVDDIFVDVEDITERVITNDYLLLCSDGLSGELDNKTIESLLQQSTNASNLVQRAKENGGRDNISCVRFSIERAE